MLQAWISLTISCYPSIYLLLPIASGKSSRPHLVSVHSCCRCCSWSSYICASVWRRASIMSSSLLLQQCPACLVRLIWMISKMGGRWPYSCCFVGCCYQDLFNVACSILVHLPSSFFSIRLVSVQVVHPYSSMDTTVAWKNIMDRSDFRMINSLSIAAHAFFRRVLMPFSVDETLLPR